MERSLPIFLLISNHGLLTIKRSQALIDLQSLVGTLSLPQVDLFSEYSCSELVRNRRFFVSQGIYTIVIMLLGSVSSLFAFRTLPLVEPHAQGVRLIMAEKHSQSFKLNG